MNDFESFLRWEEQSRDTIDFKKAYVDIAGDVVAGLMLSQIIYWYLPAHNGDEKLRVERDGKKWLVKTRDDWWAECRLSPREADRARRNLESLGILEVKVYKFSGSPTQHLRILKDRFLELWQKVVDGEKSRPKKKTSRGGGEGQGGVIPEICSSGPKSLKSPISRNGEMDLTDQEDRSYRNGQLDFTNRGFPKTETTAEITSEITAALAAGTGSAIFHVDAGLIEKLVSKGVGRKVAEQLAHEKPAVCRQYLDYLPFVKLRSTPGAWLANAIRDEYGPPEGYVKANGESTSRTIPRSTQAQIALEDLRRVKVLKLRAAYEAMAKSNGEALAAFNRYVEDEKCRVAPMARLLTEKSREMLLAEFEEPHWRMELFERWLESSGRNFMAGDRPELV